MGCYAQLTVAVLVLVISTVAAQAPAAANTTAPCPIKDFSKVDWSPAKAQCAKPDSPDFCTTCVCGVGLALVLGLDAAGTTINGKPIMTLAMEDPAATSSLLGACQTPIGVSVLQSGAVSSAAVSKLTRCDIQAAGKICLSDATPAGGESALRSSAAPVRPFSISSIGLLAVAAVLCLQLAGPDGDKW